MFLDGSSGSLICARGALPFLREKTTPASHLSQPDAHLLPTQFRALFHAASAGLFNFRSHYLFAIGLLDIFSLAWGTPRTFRLHSQGALLSRGHRDAARGALRGLHPILLEGPGGPTALMTCSRACTASIAPRTRDGARSVLSTVSCPSFSRPY